MGKNYFEAYAVKLSGVLNTSSWAAVEELANDMLEAWPRGAQIFFCGNGGSAGNANHLVNDFIYGVAKQSGAGIRAISLSANSAVMTCLANDVGYDYIFSEQLAVQANAGDLLVVLSGSGNSKNILQVLRQAKSMRVKSYAILGYGGGQALALADVAIHFPVHDMQVAEDMQLVVGHMVMQYLSTKKRLNRDI